jgi:very-short-patch-repair endonuclease
MPAGEQQRVEHLLRAALFKRLGRRARCEFRFHPRRRWRFDLCFASEKVAVEIDGNRHLKHKQARSDHEKRNAAIENGWRVLTYPASSVLTKCRLPLIVEQIARVVCGVNDCEQSAYVLSVER